MTTLSKSELNQPGIYLIRNIINGLIYIGKSINLYKRKSQYNSICNGNMPSKLYNKRFINHLFKFGKNNFEFIVLEILPYDDEILANREYYWINYYKSYDKLIGYNLAIDSSTKSIVSEETRQKISTRLKKEWKSGIRNNHGSKLKKSWQYRDRNQQSQLFSKSLTKYKYIVKFPNGDECEMSYQQLKKNQLHGVIATFHKNKINVHTKKDGTTIKRIRIEDIVQPSTKVEE